MWISIRQRMKLDMKKPGTDMTSFESPVVTTRVGGKDKILVRKTIKI